MRWAIAVSCKGAVTMPADHGCISCAVPAAHKPATLCGYSGRQKLPCDDSYKTQAKDIVSLIDESNITNMQEASVLILHAKLLPPRQPANVLWFMPGGDHGFYKRHLLPQYGVDRRD